MDSKYYGRIARCHQYCEELASEIASKLSDKARDPILKSIAKIVSADCMKHSYMLGNIAEIYNVDKFQVQDCSRYSGAAYGLYGYLKEVYEHLDEIKSDSQIKEALESLIDMMTSIGLTDRAIIPEGLNGDIKNYFLDIMIQIEDDEFRHLTLLKEYVE